MGCDDENNNCACNWDNGDCCADSGDKSQFDHCKDCKCLNPTYEPKNATQKKTKTTKSAKLSSGKAMATATMRTIIAVVNGMVVTAARQKTTKKAPSSSSVRNVFV